jgi:hypothetical protein
MDFKTWKQRHEEMMCEAERNRLAKPLRESRKRRGVDRASPLAWEQKRGAGRLFKLLRFLGSTGKGGGV